MALWYNPFQNSLEPMCGDIIAERRIAKVSKISPREKYMLTLREAAEYYHIGERKLRRMVQENPHAEYYLMSGNRVMIKRELFETYLAAATSI